LPEPFRIVFVMREIEECTVEETAASLDLKAETVKTRLHRARRLLRAAPAVGAVLVGVWLSRRPPEHNAGRLLLTAVAGFGLCIIGFALSRELWLSAALLLASGLCDGVSVVIRSTILQLATPDEMRGRVSAINGIFIGSSNELGAFESGVAAKLLGLVPSVIFGGCMTLGVVAATARLAPKLRRLDLRQLH
jgi:MFS family permease